ncbi:Uncharacterised protein [Clostridioides difficile]|nr:Uncharacterised protein [Clostridioides difficile]
MGKLVNLATINDITTQLEVNTSPKASSETAFKAEESILFPINLLKRLNQILIIIDAIKSISGITSNFTGIGFTILSIDDFTN